MQTTAGVVPSLGVRRQGPPEACQRNPFGRLSSGFAPKAKQPATAIRHKEAVNSKLALIGSLSPILPAGC